MFCSLKSVSLQKFETRPETQKERKTNTYRRSWWRHWDNRKSCGETNLVHIFIPSVHFKQKSEVSAQKLSSQRFQRLFPILTEKGSFYSRTAIRSKQTDYANFQKKKKRVYTIWILKKKNSAKDRLQMFTRHLFFKFFLFILMTLIASLITFSKKKKLEKNVTLDPRHGTLALDMEPSTLDPWQKDRLSL